MMPEHKPLFDQLSKEDMKYISSHGVARGFPQRATVLNQGDESNSVYFIDSGRVKVFVTDEQGKSTTLRYQGPGEYFGDLGLIDDEPRSASVVTTTKSQFTMISRRKFKSCLTQHPSLANKMIPLLAYRIRNLTEELAICRLSKAYLRFRAILYNLASKQSDGTLKISQKITQQEFADLIGCDRVYISRFLKELKYGRYIEENPQGQINLLRNLPPDW